MRLPTRVSFHPRWPRFRLLRDGSIASFESKEGKRVACSRICDEFMPLFLSSFAVFSLSSELLARFGRRTRCGRRDRAPDSRRRHSMLNRSLIFLVLATSAWLTSTLAVEGQGERIPFSKARILIEFNATARDVGVQVLVDGEPWKRLDIFHPNGSRILEITGRSSLREQGLTELFFESSEPSLRDVPLREFLARFPQGTYGFEGVTVDGIALEGTAALGHGL